MPQPGSRSELFNPIGKWIDEGLYAWNLHGATVSELPADSFFVPKITADSTAKHDLGTIIYATLFHDEEQSGPKFASQPENFDVSRKLGFSIIIYFVNQYGLHFGPGEPNERWYRRNPDNVNYNDTWGKRIRGNKPAEIRAIETDIAKEAKQKRIVCSIAGHDDSDNPLKGFIYSQNLRRRQRDKVANIVHHSPTAKYLANFPADKVFEIGFGGEIERGWMIVNPKDGNSFEDWVFKRFRIPSIVIEGPFGAPLDDAAAFQTTVFNAIVNSL